MNRYIISLLSLFILAAMPVAAQDDETTATGKDHSVKTEKKLKQYPTRMVRGRVVDAEGKTPVAGAIVSVAEMEGYSTLTHDDGSYELSVPTFASSLNISAPDRNTIVLGLSKSEEQRVAMLYTTSFTGDYGDHTNVNAIAETKDFRFSPAMTIEDEIQSRLGSQVHTTTRNGTPGIGSVMFADGISSLNINAQPLIVVDGVVFDQQFTRQTLHEGFYNDILSNIRPSDIERVEVLRNGTALYGAKGSNGVILITTRRNHSMATRITGSVSAGVTMEPRYFDVMDADQYRSYASDLLKTTSTTIKDFKFLNDSPDYYYYPQYHNNTDWKKYVYRSAFTQDYSINVEGGDNVADYNLSLGFSNAQSTLKYNNVSRINIRFNSDIRLTGRLGVRFDASFANQTRNLRNDGAPENYTEGVPTSAAFLAYAKSPMLSPYTFASGKISDNYIDVSDESYLDEALADYTNYNYRLANPLAVNEFGDAENKNHFENSMINLAVTPKYHFNSHLSLSEHFSYNLINTNEKFYIPLNGVPAYYVSSVNAYCENEVRSMAGKQNSVMSDSRLEYKNRFAAHGLDLMGGVRFNWEKYKLDSQLGYNTSSDKMPSIGTNLDHPQTFGRNDNWKNIAWYLQANYNFMQRYYLQANVTAETSSRFGQDADQAVKMLDVPWGIFHGVQAAWVITNEPWMTHLRGIDYLRLSAGYDVTGNDDLDYHAARSYFNAKDFLEDVTGLSFDNIGNNHLQWETTKRLNIGIETHLVNHRLNVQFNLFKAKTDHLLMMQPLHYLTGLEYNWANMGSMENKGFDASFLSKVIATKNFQWELGASVGHYTNKMTAISNQTDAVEASVYGATIRTQVGYAANMFYGYRTLGVFSTSEEAAASGLYILDENGIDKKYFGAGDIHFVDLDGDGQITLKDREMIGNPNPDIYGNIFTSMAYKRFRLAINFNYSLGNDVYNYMRSQLEAGSRFMNQTTAMTRRWQTEGQQTDMPKAVFQDPMGNSRFSDRWIEDGSYLKLKNITLSYTLPMHSTLLQGFQFWIQANNVFTLSKYLGADPETTMTSSVIGQGIDLGCIPQSRNFVIGMKINL